MAENFISPTKTNEALNAKMQTVHTERSSTDDLNNQKNFEVQNTHKYDQNEIWLQLTFQFQSCVDLFFILLSITQHQVILVFKIFQEH